MIHFSKTKMDSCFFFLPSNAFVETNKTVCKSKGNAEEEFHGKQIVSSQSGMNDELTLVFYDDGLATMGLHGTK